MAADDRRNWFCRSLCRQWPDWIGSWFPRSENPDTRHPAKLEDWVPPPILWTQIPCFLEVTDRVALQNIENNEVPCKIFQDKELRAVSASTGRFRLDGGTKRTYQNNDLKEDF
jgi:hypothetical protein